MGLGMDEALAERLAVRSGLHVRAVEVLDVPVNDVARVETDEGCFALKLYHPGRSHAQVAWEVELVRHLGARGAPVALPVMGREGSVLVSEDSSGPRCAVLWTWVGGSKPRPGAATYERLGRVAALLHAAADDVAPSPARERYDLRLLVDDQLARMRSSLLAMGEWARVVALGERLRARLGDPRLDRGVCHMDLTLDNVLEQDGALTAIDFDSAGPSWRAVEPYGVLRFSAAHFRSWLAGYRAVRPFSQADEEAVAVFGVVGDLRVTTWKLGLADSSSGPPLLTLAELPAVVEGWLAWERRHLTG